MDISQVAAAVANGTPVKTVLNPGAECPLQFGSFGHIAYRVLVRSNTKILLSGGVEGQLQNMLIMIQQAPSGGAEVAWPDNIIWDGGKPPFIDSQAGSLTFATIITLDGGKRYYGRAGF